MKHQSVICGILLLLIAVGTRAQSNLSAFQPFNTQGANLIHITTADFDGVGVKDYVVAMTVEGKVIAFQRPVEIAEPGGDNRLWEYSAVPSMEATLIAAAVVKNSTSEELILPMTDGYLRILSSTGKYLILKLFQV